MTRWRLPLTAAISWVIVALVLSAGLPAWLIWLPPLAVMFLALVWGQFAVVRISIVWGVLALICLGVLQYRETLALSLPAGVQELEFETLGDSKLSADSYITWIAVAIPETPDSLLPGMLISDQPLTPTTRYRALVDIGVNVAPAERSTFWAELLDDSLVIMPPNAFDETVLQLRGRFLQHAIGLTPDSRALVAGLAIGERSLLSEELEAQMRQLSLTHLVAVSGANLAIVAGGVFLVFAAIGASRATRLVAATFAIVLYVALVGPEPSVLRAGFMALVVMLGQSFGRGNQSLNALSLAVVCLVHLDPFLALDFGFTLSVAATFGLLVVAPLLFQRFKNSMNLVLAASLAVAVAAQLYTFPVLLLLENRVATYSILANLLAEPVVAPVTVLGVASVLASYLSPQLGGMLSWLASLGTAWIETIAQHLSGFPAVSFAWLPQPFSTAAALLILASVTLWLMTSQKHWFVIASATLLVSIGWSATDHLRFQAWPAEDWDVVACDVLQGDAILVKSGGQIMLIDTGREPNLLMDCLARLRVDRIDFLVLSHFDADHVAAVPELVESVPIGQVLVSGFRDDRPLTNIVREALMQKGIPILTGQAGLEFTLGAGKVKILQPSLTAAEAVDSNDASLVISANFAEYSLLSLGDLGEEGQLRLLRNTPGDLLALSRTKLVLKVSHHGSKDQSADLTKALKVDVALISAGPENPYGHPTPATLDLLQSSGAAALRTDTHGSIALSFGAKDEIFAAGKL